MIGKTIRQMRMKKGISIAELARRMKCSRPYLYDVEASVTPIAPEVLYRISDSLALSPVEAREFGINIVKDDPDLKKTDRMLESSPDGITNREPVVNIKVPDSLSILYSDMVSVTSTDFGIVFDFGQKMGPTNQVNIVSRIGMSAEHAKALSKLLINKLDEKK